MQKEVNPLLGQQVCITVNEEEHLQDFQGVFDVFHILVFFLVILRVVVKYLKLFIDELLHEYVYRGHRHIFVSLAFRPVDSVRKVSDAVFPFLHDILRLLFDHEVDGVIVGKAEALSAAIQIGKHFSNMVSRVLGLVGAVAVFSQQWVFCLFDDLVERRVQIKALAV